MKQRRERSLIAQNQKRRKKKAKEKTWKKTFPYTKKTN